ncbi:uncharacterized protein LOC124693143 [Lolium rigidum]|uniref:uncharacterized protein LOC124693143 n=1 Tax=Lolium rigidum TaxID=89674 RepID=UPI001F5C8942|nr:uncharacterized protein LOC124693143 [Lolium rigidum]
MHPRRVCVQDLWSSQPHISPSSTGDLRPYPSLPRGQQQNLPQAPRRGLTRPHRQAATLATDLAAVELPAWIRGATPPAHQRPSPNPRCVPGLGEVNSRASLALSSTFGRICVTKLRITKILE